MANSTHCTLSRKASIKTSKEQIFQKQSEKEKKKVVSEDRNDVGERDTSPEPKAKMDLEIENWASSPSERGLEQDAPESEDHTQNYYC